MADVPDAKAKYTLLGYKAPDGKVYTESNISSYKINKDTVFTVTVRSRVPSVVTSSIYTVSGGNISKIAVETTVKTLLSGLNEGSYCSVYNGTNELTPDSIVGTGMLVKIIDGTTVKASYTIIVTGDTNGDGKITITDMLAVKAHVLKKSTLNGIAAKAADTSGDQSISITDFIQLKAHILGKDDVEPSGIVSDAIPQQQANPATITSQTVNDTNMSTPGVVVCIFEKKPLPAVLFKEENL